MNKKITFRGTQHSEILENYANQQLAKIEDFLSHERDPIYIELIFTPSKTREHHRVELLVKTPHYDKVSFYEYKGTEFYDVVDRVIDTMYKELHEAKQRLVDERKWIGRHDEFKKQR